MRHLVLAVLLIASTTATTCGRTMMASQSLRPAPTIDCLRAALQSSPDVIRITREIRPDRGFWSDGGADEGFWADLRDSTAEGGERHVSIHRGYDGARPSRFLSLNFHWPDMRKPPEPEERAVASLAARVLAHLQRSCAPDGPGVAMCQGGRKARPSAPAA